MRQESAFCHLICYTSRSIFNSTSQKLNPTSVRRMQFFAPLNAISASELLNQCEIWRNWWIRNIYLCPSWKYWRDVQTACIPTHKHDMIIVGFCLTDLSERMSRRLDDITLEKHDGILKHISDIFSVYKSQWIQNDVSEFEMVAVFDEKCWFDKWLYTKSGKEPSSWGVLK